jgi:hypothetical protein
VGVFVMGALLGWPTQAAGQEPAPALPLQVLLDCQAFGCDDDFIMTELTWVSWVRDRQTADVHILITSQETGGGGESYTLDFIGNRAYVGRDQRLILGTPGDATEDDAREALLERIGLGLVPFALGTAAAERLSVDYDAPEGDDAQVVVDDPWNFWVFEIGMDADLEGEDRQRETQLQGSFTANRTTAAWRLESGVEFDRTDEERELRDSTLTSTRENWSVENFAVTSTASCPTPTSPGGRSRSSTWSAGTTSSGTTRRSTASRRKIG